MTTTQSNPLERVAAKGLAQRHAEQIDVSTTLFTAALCHLPPELKPLTTLVSSSADSKRVRLEIAGAAFDLETTDSASHPWKVDEYRLYHAGLPLGKAIESLEDYSRERAEAQSRWSAQRELGTLRLTLIGSAIYTGAIIVILNMNGITNPDLATAIGIAVFITLLITLFRALDHGRIWTAFFPVALKPVGAAMREGFDRWQAAIPDAKETP